MFFDQNIFDQNFIVQHFFENEILSDQIFVDQIRLFSLTQLCPRSRDINKNKAGTVLVDTLYI